MGLQSTPTLWSYFHDRGETVLRLTWGIDLVKEKKKQNSMLQGKTLYFPLESQSCVPMTKLHDGSSVQSHWIHDGLVRVQRTAPPETSWRLIRTFQPRNFDACMCACVTDIYLLMILRKSSLWSQWLSHNYEKPNWQLSFFNSISSIKNVIVCSLH